MPFTQFTARDLSNNFGIKFKAEHLFEHQIIEPIEPSPWLIETIKRGTRSMNINAGEQDGLNGECDFMLSFSLIQDFVIAPIFSITEAKKQDIEQGTVQCAAQLIAANILNQKDNYPFKTLFGCSTTGTEWRFLKLEDKTITLDIGRYYLNDLNQLLSILQHIVKQANQEYLEF